MKCETFLLSVQERGSIHWNCVNHIVGFSLLLKNMLVVEGFFTMVVLFKEAAQGGEMRGKGCGSARCGSVALGSHPGAPCVL